MIERTKRILTPAFMRSLFKKTASSILALFFVASTAWGVDAVEKEVKSLQRTTRATPTPYADVWSQKQTVVNRAILSVGKRLYTLVDLYTILGIWNLSSTAENQVAITSDWWRMEQLSPDKKGWPPDAKRFHAIVTNWPEVERLGLFPVTEAEIKALLLKVRQDKIWSNFPAEVQAYIKSAPESELRASVIMVLRSKLAEKSWGMTRETSATWFWHASQTSTRQ